jgi:DNA-dependent RNA polymerase auxiliary subunit epsilon
LLKESGIILSFVVSTSSFSTSIKKETSLMKKLKYSNLWLLFVNIKARKGLKFVDLIDTDDAESMDSRKKYIGAWANLLIKADTINKAIDIAPLGLKELNFEIKFIDKIENLGSLLEYNEIKNDVIEEAEWLLKSGFIFKISDKLFPYEKQ